MNNPPTSAELYQTKGDHNASPTGKCYKVFKIHNLAGFFCAPNVITVCCYYIKFII